MSGALRGQLRLHLRLRRQHSEDGDETGNGESGQACGHGGHVRLIPAAC